MAEKHLVYVGTYTTGSGGASKGIYVYELDTASGEIRFAGAATKTPNPSFIVLSPDHKFLYSVNELEEFDGIKGGSVEAYAIRSGTLEFHNRQPTHGGSPCYISLSTNGRFLLAANYGSGNLSVLPVLEDGSLGEPSDVMKHEGSSVDTKRQKAPHAHSIIESPDGGHVLAADLGIDKIMIYKLDSETGKLISKGFAPMRPGAGPRHIVFGAHGSYVYVVNELDSTITVLEYEKTTGGLTEKQTISTLPDDFAGDNTGADMHFHPSFEFLYASNRGHDSIAVFAVDPITGILSPIEHTSTEGSQPRNFAIDPSGQFLIVANQTSDNIVSLRIDEKSGQLTPTGHQVKVSKPVCLRVLSAF